MRIFDTIGNILGLIFFLSIVLFLVLMFIKKYLLETYRKKVETGADIMIKIIGISGILLLIGSIVYVIMGVMNKNSH